MGRITIHRTGLTVEFGPWGALYASRDPGKTVEETIADWRFVTGFPAEWVVIDTDAYP